VELVSYVVIAIAGYLLGSIPTGFLVAQAKGIDIRAVGSGNIGATNVLRALGKPAGAFVLFMDALKGWLAVVPLSELILLAFGLASDARAREVGAIVGSFSVILGHNFTCWLQFKGGKGIATSAGVLLALVPWALLIIVIVWIIVFASTRYVSLASITAALVLPLASWVTQESTTRIMVTGALGILAVCKHKPNIQRLLHGTEARFGSKSKENAS
jgi:acyl phosphate:glycerol-3-phosphate acyltransferase